MKKVLLIAAVLILCISGAAYAQTTMPVLCGDLPQEDCDLLTRSQEAMSMLDSAALDFSMNVTITNIPDMTNPATITVMGNGAFSGAASLYGDMTDMAALQADPGQAVLSVLDNLDFDFSLTVSVPPELMEEADPGIPNSLTLHMSLVDGVGYLDLDPLQGLLGDLSDSGMAGWVGLDLANLVRALMERMPDLFSGMTAGMDAAMMDSTAMQTYMEEFNDPEFLSQFATIEKVDVGMPDETTFRVTIDFGALMSSPAFQDMMLQQMQAQSPGLSEEEVSQAMAMSSEMLQNMTFTLDETIGNDDAYMRAIHGTFSLDTAEMMAAMESESGNMSDQPAPTVSVDVTLFYNSFDSVPPITAPEDANVFPYQSLLGMIEQMSGAMSEGT